MASAENYVLAEKESKDGVFLVDVCVEGQLTFGNVEWDKNHWSRHQRRPCDQNFGHGVQGSLSILRLEKENDYIPILYLLNIKATHLYTYWDYTRPYSCVEDQMGRLSDEL